MWPNEQINGISFCGALMNGENVLLFFFFFTWRGGGGWVVVAGGGDHAHGTNNGDGDLRLAALERNQWSL